LKKLVRFLARVRAIRRVINSVKRFGSVAILAHRRVVSGAWSRRFWRVVSLTIGHFGAWPYAPLLETRAQQNNFVGRRISVREKTLSPLDPRGFSRLEPRQPPRNTSTVLLPHPRSDTLLAVD